MDGYAEMSDIQLAKSAAEGDESAFAEIVRRYSPRVFSFASRFFRRRELVEEAAQEVFLKAFTQIGKYEGRGSLEGWLTRITMTVCLNLLRTAKRQPEIENAPLTEDESVWLENKMSGKAIEKHESAEQKIIAADLVDRVMENLKPEDRLILMLLDGEDFKVREAAEITGWSAANVKVKAFRARRKMRKEVEKLLAKSEDNQK